MSKQHWSLGVLIALLLSPMGLAVEAKHDGDGHGNTVAVAAESDPVHDGTNGSEAVHAAAADGESHGGGDEYAEGHAAHDPFDAALHGNATPQTSALNGQNNPAEWKSSLAIWTMVVFGCLTAILWKFAWGPIRDALDARERSVQENIDAAKAQNEKAAALLAQHETKLANTADEVRKILDDAKRDAETTKQGILAEAESAAEAQKTRAVQEINAAKNGALEELAQKSVDTAVGLAGKIVQRQLSADDHASLISDAIKAFPSKN